MNARILVALSAVLGVVSFIAGASEHPSADDIAARLNGQARSWGQADPDRGITNTASGAGGEAAIDLTINFEFNSAILTEDGLVLVGNLGRALKDPRLAGKRFRIEGHTDGVGGDTFNQRLSERRAEAVRNQLLTRYAVKAGLVEVVGYGKSRLLAPSQPTSGVNRRVRVVNLGRE